MKNNIPLAIILKRTQNGYIFESLEEVNPNKDKNKKSKLGRKPASKGVPNRLIKEIALNNEQLFASQISPTPEPPQNIQQIQEEPQQQNQPQPVNEEEEIFCEIERQTSLPKSPAIWFDKLKIHQIEKKELPEFFSTQNKSKTSQLYLKYRNFMIDSYERNPKKYLTKISCRRILRGDVNTIMRIHTLLERHGIINFGVGNEGNYIFKANSLTKQFEERTKPQSCLKSLPQNDEQTAQKQVDTDNMTLTVINKNFSRTYRPCCSTCRLICGVIWYANIQDQQSDQQNLCYQCYKKMSEKQKQQLTKIDIVKKMENHGKDAKSIPKNAWNIEQNIKLLDFMSDSKNQSWKKLLDYFAGKRTIQDIVLQFLQFPISNIEIKKAKKQLEKQLQQQKTKQSDFGYNSSDYMKILRDFYQSSSYSKRVKTQIQVKQSMNQKSPLRSQTNITPDNTNGVKTVLNLTIQKMTYKIKSLNQQESLIQLQTKLYESPILNKRQLLRITQIDDVQEEQPLMVKSSSELNENGRPKSTRQIKQMRQKTTLVKGINDNSQQLENMEQNGQILG